MPCSARRSVRLLLAAAAVAGAAALAGCSPSGPASTDGPQQTGSTSAPGSTDGAPGPSESTTPDPATPFEIGCDDLLTAEQVYAFNPNYGTAPDYEPTSPAVLAVVDAGGTACGWMNQTSGELVEVAVATPSEQALAAAASDAATRLQPVPTYGTPPALEGYFGRSGADGSAQVFSGRYWIVIASPALFEPGDAASLVAAVVGNLPAA